MSARSRSVAALQMLATHWQVVSVLAGGMLASASMALLPTLLHHTDHGISFAVFHGVVSLLAGCLVWQCLQERMLRMASAVVGLVGIHFLLSAWPILLPVVADCTAR